jgi:hypothetical protein
MTAPQSTASAIPEHWAEPVAHYVERLVALCGPRLLGVTLYGPWRHQPAPSGPTLSSVVVFDRIDLEALRRVGEEGYRFGRQGLAAPWVLTPEGIDTSRDTFPLELIAIAAEHVTPHGTDYFGNLAIEPAHVRLACERELRVIEIHLERGLLTAGRDEEHLGRLVQHSGHSLLGVLRGLLWLNSQRKPLAPFELVGQSEKLLSRQLPGVRRSLDHADTAHWSKFQQFHADILALGRLADGWP